MHQYGYHVYMKFLLLPIPNRDTKAAIYPYIQIVYGYTVSVVTPLIMHTYTCT